MDTQHTMRIGILGGTFNPIHTGHLILAQDALEQFELNRVLFVPCAKPPHKKAAGLLPAEHRLRMIEVALEGDLRFEISPVELQRGGTSYTIDTLRELARLWPRARFYLILGGDSLLELHLWKDVYALLALCEVVTLVRPGHDERPITAETISLRAPWPDRLLKNVWTGHRVEISSSDIRRRVAEGMSIRYLVHPAVEMYIAEHGLYMMK